MPKGDLEVEALRLVIDLLVAALAGCQVVETWHHGSIFQSSRDWLKLQRYDGRRSWPVRKLSELLIQHALTLRLPLL